MRVLKRCPSCGSKALLVTTKEGFYESLNKNGSACALIECQNRLECGISMFCHYKTSNYEEMIEEAANRWNRRTVCVKKHPSR